MAMAHSPLPHPTRCLRMLYVCLVLFLLPCGNAQGQVLFRGRASYYHDSLHGRKTASGKPYHRDSMTCAHLRLPFGTMLLVRNIKNEKEVVVTVTDRGPYAKRYVLDLSRAAARELDIIGKGFAHVEVSHYTPDRVPFLLEEHRAEIPTLDLEMQELMESPYPMWLEADSVN